MKQLAQFAMIRALFAMLTLVIVSLIVFTLMELVPGDCAERYLAFKNTQGSGISVQDIENERSVGRCGSSTPFKVNSATAASCVLISHSFLAPNSGCRLVYAWRHWRLPMPSLFPSASSPPPAAAR
jgi:peptide/nickel transport system permease protein